MDSIPNCGIGRLGTSCAGGRLSLVTRPVQTYTLNVCDHQVYWTHLLHSVYGTLSALLLLETDAFLRCSTVSHHHFLCDNV